MFRIFSITKLLRLNTPCCYSKKSFFLFTLLLISSYFGIAQTNLLTNGGLENWSGSPEAPIDWSVLNAPTYSKSSDANEGNFAIKIPLTQQAGPYKATFETIGNNNIQLQANKTYTFSVDYKVVAATVQAITAYVLRDGNIQVQSGSQNPPEDGSWHTLTFDINTTVATEHSIDIELTAFGSGAEILLDNIKFEGEAVNPDRDALIALYNAMDGDNWTNSWNLNADMDSWAGVILNDNGRVIRLFLNGYGLKGSLPKELGNLPFLTVLELRKTRNTTLAKDNEITGNIPSEIGNLSNLEYCSLRNLNLSGAIPTEICNLSKLESLHLAGNQLSGSLPSTIGDLTNLVVLSIAQNNFMGTLPEEIGNLSNLTSFYASFNDFELPLPTSFFNLPNLSRIDLTSNQLEGEIPKELGQLQSLETLKLDYNDLTGNIPKEIGLLQNLISLNINNSSLSGNIPAELGQLQSLQILNLSNNNLNGKLPPQLGQLSNLKQLSLTLNSLSGSIPFEIAQLQSLEKISIGLNEFSDKIPVFTSPSINSVQINQNNFVYDDFIEMYQALNLPSEDLFLYYEQANIGSSETIILNIGMAYTLTVNETNEVNNTYQWRKNGEAITNATNSTYIIDSFSVESEGEYDCVINNALFPQLTLHKNPISLYGDDDNDGVPNNLDVCENTPPGAVVGSTGCSYQDVLLPKPDDFTVKVTSTSCENANNGEISVSFKVSQTHFIEVTGPNGFLENYTKQNGSSLVVTDLATGNYTVIINSQVGLIAGAPNTEFNLNLETPEDFLSGKTSVDLTSRTGRIVVSGSKNYGVFVNDATMNFSFNDTGRHELTFDLEDGANNVLVKTDKNCQGEFAETVMLNSIRVFPNPTADMVTILGLKNAADATISISDLSGVLIKSYSENISNASAVINVEELSEGMYLVRVKSKEQDVQTKIIKK